MRCRWWRAAAGTAAGLAFAMPMPMFAHSPRDGYIMLCTGQGAIYVPIPGRTPRPDDQPQNHRMACHAMTECRGQKVTCKRA